MKSTEAPQNRLMRNKAISILVGTIFLTLFAFLAAWGVYGFYRIGWCEPGVFCEMTLDAVIHAFGCALVSSSGAAFLFIWGLRGKLIFLRPIILGSIGFICAGLLVVAHPVVLNIRSAISAQFFPYVIALRFGALGFYIVWGIVSLLVCAVVMGVAVFLNEKKVLQA